MYLILLLSEDYFSGLIGLFKVAVVACLYALAFFFLFHNRRTSELKPIGVGLALLLAYIGFRTWPDTYSWEGHTSADYLLVLLLCIPLMAAGLVYALTSKSPEQ